MRILKIFLLVLLNYCLQAQVKPEWTVLGKDFFYVNGKLDATKKMAGFTNMSFLDNGTALIVLESEPVNLYDGSFYSTQKIKYQSSNPATKVPSGGMSGIVGAVVDKQGDIWYGNGTGLYRIPAAVTADLKKMASQPGGEGTWISDDTPGMPFGMITHIAKDSNGNIWVVGGKKRGSSYVASGISKFDGTKWENYLPAGSESKLISFLSTDRFGGVWTISSDTKINHFQNGEWKSFTDTPSKTTALIVDELNTVYAGTTGGILTWKENKWQPLSLPGLPEYMVNDLTFDKKGNLWIASDYGVFCRNKAGGVYQFDMDNSPLVSKLVTKVVVDAQDKKWFVSTAGIVGFKEPDLSSAPNAFTKYNSGYVDGGVEAAVPYQNGFLLANIDVGLIGFDGKSFSTLTPKGNSEVMYLSLAVDKDGVAYLGTYRFIHKYDGKTYDKWEWKDETGKQVNDLLFDNQNALWIASKGISKFNGSAWQTFDKKSAGLSSNSVLKLYKDGKGNLWATLSDGVAKYDGTTWTSFTKKTAGMGLGNMKMAETADNRLLFSNGYTLIECDGTTMKEVAGFKNAGDLSNMIVTADGSLLLATKDKGVVKFKDGVLSSVSGLPSQEINYIFKDKEGKSWACFGYQAVEPMGFPAMGTQGAQPPAETPAQVFEKRLKKANVVYGIVRLD